MKVFPVAEKYIKPEGCDLGFALGMTALELKPYKVTELFGLTLLFEALNDPWRARVIDDLYGFTNRNFVSLNSELDVFSIRAFAEQAGKTEKLSLRLTEIENSKAWKLAIMLRRMRLRFFPPGSTREKFAHFILQPVLRYLEKAGQRQ